jgi:putative phosphoribosyl transferase
MARETTVTRAADERPVRITIGHATIDGDLTVPPGARGIVIFAHGTGSGRYSPRNRFVAGVLNQAGLATLLIDLLTPEEERIDLRTAHLRFDIGLLAARLLGATDWVRSSDDAADLHRMHIGYFGASTGAGAALLAAAQRPDVVEAIVSRGGRPDLAGDELLRVRAPTLLIVGGNDLPVLALNQEALQRLPAEKKLVVIPGATHLFEEPGALEEVARLAAEWFQRYLAPPA